MRNTDELWEIISLYVRDHEELLDSIGLLKRVRGWIRSRSVAKLASLEMEVPAYIEAGSQAHCAAVLRQLPAFVKKCRDFTDPETELGGARDAFLRSERLCAITNRRLDWYLHDHPERLAPDMAEYLFEMKRYVATTLGDFGTFLDTLPRRLRLTSGATTTRSRRDSSPVKKVTRKEIPCTTGARPYLAALTQLWGEGKASFRILAANRVTVVPKNYKTGRLIACEPDGNLPLQLAFDGYAKERLSRKGVDLRSQVLNQRLAKEGSIQDNLATLDLSMASDTLSEGLVAFLLPEQWFDFLNSVRCKYANVSSLGIEDSTVVRLQKFSSMGNGATFTLETLVFAAAVHAVGASGSDRSFAVYGDDIVIRSDRAAELQRVLQFCGFVINGDKSYTSGPFRESCGEDYWRGVRITPFYVRELSERPARVCHHVNGLAAIAKPGGVLWTYLSSVVWNEKLPLVPYQEDTMAGIHIPAHEGHVRGLIRRRLSSNGEGLFVKGFRPRAKRVTKTFEQRDWRYAWLWFIANGGETQSCHAPWECGRSAADLYLLRVGLRGVWPFVEERLAVADGEPAVDKRVRGWVRYVPPAVVAPAHLYWWAETLA